MSRWERTNRMGAADYDRRFEEAERAGTDVHGEASFVASLVPAGGSVLDAGCGTGRVAAELARRGFQVVGADLDERMLEGARAKAPELDWRRLDLAAPGLAAALGRRFDAVVAAGNVMIFLEPGTEAAVVANLAGALAPGGVLVAGFQLGGGHLPLDAYDAHCRSAGLELAERWATWDREPWAEGDYAVSVHRAGRTLGG
ncbi:MAG TPA: class I SAM-dependent methyltransferase [Acidimicrobiales bacterium]|nr:class I SAM-dependent methyltransferase [Acidimicrobiales bacterium]